MSLSQREWSITAGETIASTSDAGNLETSWPSYVSHTRTWGSLSDQHAKSFSSREYSGEVPQRRSLGRWRLLYGHVISFIVAPVHNTKSLVCQINIQSDLLSCANLATKNIDRGQCDEVAPPLWLIPKLAGMFAFSFLHGTQSRLGLNKTGHQDSGEKTKGGTHPKAWGLPCFSYWMQ